jgi:hypothetical protein
MFGIIGFIGGLLTMGDTVSKSTVVKNHVNAKLLSYLPKPVALIAAVFMVKNELADLGIFSSLIEKDFTTETVVYTILIFIGGFIAYKLGVIIMRGTNIILMAWITGQSRVIEAKIEKKIERIKNT